MSLTHKTSSISLSAQRIISQSQSKLLIPQSWRQPRRAAAAASLQQKSHFHQSHSPQTFKPVWTEARVKVPWVEALARKRRGEEGLTSEASAVADAKGAAGAQTEESAPTLVREKKWGMMKTNKVLEEQGIKVQQPVVKKVPKKIGVDLTPRRMKDSYYRTVCVLLDCVQFLSCSQLA